MSITQHIVYSESHQLSEFHTITIELERRGEKEWQGVVWMHTTHKLASSGLALYTLTRPMHEQLNDVLMQVRARIEHKFEQMSAQITQSMRGAEHA